jgi:hypothetical protein
LGATRHRPETGKHAKYYISYHSTRKPSSSPKDIRIETDKKKWQTSSNSVLLKETALALQSLTGYEEK